MAGHEKDYSWITGRVFRADGGRWVLRYAGAHEVDSHGGSVLLTPKPGMPTLHDGDLVCVHGKVIGGRVPRAQAGAVYDASEINVITLSASCFAASSLPAMAFAFNWMVPFVSDGATAATSVKPVPQVGE